jgi:replicative DNA helicase
MNDKPYKHISEIAQEAYSERMAILNGEVTHISTGFPTLNSLVYGWGKGDMIVIAARPSMGKSAFMLSSALNIAAMQIPVGIFSLEMSSVSMALRAVSATSLIPMSSLMRMNNELDNLRMPDSFAEIASLPIFMDDIPGLNLALFEEKFASMVSEHNIGCVFIDYLQLIDERSTRSREQEIGKISRKLKQLAKLHQTPIVSLAQLNRDVDKRPDKKPMIADLRESGSIEQDSDVVLLIYNPYKYGIETYEDGVVTEGTAEIIVAKQRNGETGAVRLGFDGKHTRFHELPYKELIKPLEIEVKW